MTEPAKKPGHSASKQKSPDPGISQRTASNPKSSAWVTASAGTGKTKVLADRVLRLMLNGAKPNQILCMTFTRNAAAEMTERLHKELSLWTTCDDKTLTEKLTKLEGKKPKEATKTRARQLFAEFLDDSSGMRIQTIHSFSQSLIRKFPIESGIPPYFDVMDEQTATEMLQESQADILRQIQKEPDTQLARAVMTITSEVSEEDLSNLISLLTYRRGQLLSIFDQHGGGAKSTEGVGKTIDKVYEYMKVPRDADIKEMRTAINRDSGLNGTAPDIAALQRAADILVQGSAVELDKAKMIKAWIMNPEQREEMFDGYSSVFLTRENTIRKKLTTKATAAAQEILEQEAQRLERGLDEIADANVAKGTEYLMLMISAILQKYSEKKRSLNMLDYDDLVYRANLMMSEDNATGWVLQKLPGDLKHVLIDEAQDTNPDQWQLISSIATEFFKTPAKDRTLFVVGDEKQSIFSFQRADPQEFGRRKKFFSDLVTGAGGKWEEVKMEIAFRSSPAITEAVDAVFANPEASDGLFFKDDQSEQKVRHDPFRRGQAGLIELHPVIKGEKAAPIEPWSLPLQREEADNPSVELAEQIADKIKEMLTKGDKLESRDREIIPSDIMILVRRRSQFVDHIVHALNERDIPVAGADRISLHEQIVVKDLVALGQTLLFPKDDEKLACVLKSPLIGMNDQQLEDLCIDHTPGELWETLEKKAADKDAPAIYRESFEYLSNLRARLNKQKPYEFYSSVLMETCPALKKSGLYAVYSRLGTEADDAMVEFLNAIERFEKKHVPTLQGLFSWLEAGETEVKREINLTNEVPRVHIMTVHGSKGLEAPIVILPDTTGIPSDNTLSRPRFLWPDGNRSVPLWAPRADFESASYIRERQRAELERDREYRRLLYVAMTRAADRLYVYGSSNSGKVSEKSWYSLIQKGLKDNVPGLEEVDPDTGLTKVFEKAAANDNVPAAKGEEPDLQPEKILRFKVRQSVRPTRDNAKALNKAKPVGIPVWARDVPKVDQSRIEKFRPSEYLSSMNDITAPSPLEAPGESYYIQLGTVIHQLFEFLPSLPKEERESAALKYLAKPAWKIAEKDQVATAKQVMLILNDPEFGALFGKNSRAEVSITGLFDRKGQKQVMSGQIDRLVVDDKSVTIIDFKNSRSVPQTVDKVDHKYIVQMASYRLALQQIYPDKEIKCALLYTREAKLIPLPATKLQKALDNLDLKPSKPSPGAKPPSM